MPKKLEVRVDQKLGVINFNFEEVKSNLTEMMELYSNTEVTEDTSVSAKKDIATLRKIKKALNDRKIEVKKEYMKPYDDFEIRVKELATLIDKPIELIDKQVQVFEKKKKAEKKQKIQDTYKELIGEMEEYLPLAKIYDSKWENASTTIKSIKEEIEQAVSSTEMAVNTIKGMNSEVVNNALDQFKKDLSLANAISYINKHEQMKAEILAKEEQKRKEEEERKRKAEEERIREEERKRVKEKERIREEARQKAIEEERQRIAEEEKNKAEEERKQKEEEQKQVEKIEVIPTVAKDEVAIEVIEEEPFVVEKPLEDDEEAPFVVDEKVKATFTVVGTFEELEQIETYLNSVGLSFERNDN